MTISSRFKIGTPERRVAERLMTTRKELVERLGEEEFFDLIEEVVRLLGTSQPLRLF